MSSAFKIGSSLLSGVDGCERYAVRLSGLRRELESGAGRRAVAPTTIRRLRGIEEALRRPLRLAILGESNSGKSTVTNLLLGISVLPTLQVSNTRIPTLLSYGEKAEASGVIEGGRTARLTRDARPPDAIELLRVKLPLTHLRNCEILDFPGFFDPLLGYGVGDISGYRIDAAIWCTFSSQAWKESERFAWLRLPLHARRPGLLAVTNMDRLRSDQAAKVKARLETVARSDFRDFAFLSCLDAKKGFDAKGVVTDVELWQGSGAARLHDSLGQLLQDLRAERLRKARALTLKLTDIALKRLPAPVGSGRTISGPSPSG
jgi:hypothetical protein